VTHALERVTEPCRALPEAEFWMGFARGGLDEAFFKTGKRLKLVQLISAGYDAIDMAAARRSGIPVCNNGGSNSVSVAEHSSCSSSPCSSG